MSEDDITVRDHITIKDRGDERRVPDSGVSLYVDEGKIKAVTEDGERDLPIETVTAERSVTDQFQRGSLNEPVQFSTDGTRGGWSWFADPRAVHHNGVTYVAYKSMHEKDIRISAYDHANKSFNSHAVDIDPNNDYSSDDHGNPTILIRDDGHLIVFWCVHNLSALYYAISTNPEDASSWGSVQTVGFGSDTDYQHHFHRTEDDGTIRVYIVINRSLHQITSTDGGSSWSSETQIVSGNNHYYKAGFDGSGRIDFAVTDTSQGLADLPKIDIRYGYLEGGTVYAADGSVIGSPPVDFNELTTVYDTSAAGNDYAWVWDCAYNGGNPEIVYATFPSRYDHRYRYAKWDGSQWVDSHITKAGEHMNSGVDGELYYSNGVVLDHENDGVVYGSVGNYKQSRIHRFETDDDGETWKFSQMSGSQAQNVRPTVPRNSHSDIPLVWMQGYYNQYAKDGFDCHVLGGGPINHSLDTVHDNHAWGGARAGLNTDTDIPSGSWAALPIDFKFYNMRYNEWRDGGEDELKLSGDAVVVNQSGLYYIGGSIEYSSVSASGTYTGRVGFGSERAIHLNTVDTGGGNPRVTGSDIIFLRRGNIIKLFAKHDSGSQQTVSGDPDRTHLTVYQID